MNTALCDLYGGTSTISNNRDISIQPFATSSILQHHYQATSSSPLAVGSNPVGSELSYNNKQHADNATGQQHQQTKGKNSALMAFDQAGGELLHDNGSLALADNGASSMQNKSGASASNGQVSCQLRLKLALCSIPLCNIMLLQATPSTQKLQSNTRHRCNTFSSSPCADTSWQKMVVI